MANRNRRSRKLSYQPLESRQMLAGDVQVFIAGDVLNIVGDDLANEVQITQDASGSFVVSGVDTTINNSSTDFVASQESLRHISMFLRDGNDTATLTGTTLTGGFSFYGDQGDDRLTVTDSNARHLHLNGGEGGDIFDMGITVQKSAYFYLGAGDDVVALQTVFAGRNLKVFGGEGNDTVASNSLTVGRKLVFDLANGDDSVMLTGATSIRKTATIRTGNGSDFVSTTSNGEDSIAFRRGLKLNAGAGDDSVALSSNVTLNKRTRIDGSSGTDSFLRGDAVGTDAKVVKFEAFEVADLQTQIDAVFATLTNANIDFDGDNQTDPLEMTVSTTSLSFAEGSDAIAVDSELALTGADSSSVTSATVSLDEFQFGEDTLAFEGTDNITGAFNTIDGTLTLSGTDTLANYQAALRTVTFINSSEDPNTTQRTIQFNVTSGDESVTGSRTLDIVSVNDAPTITLATATRTVTPSELPVTLDDALTLVDVDSTQLTQAIVQLTDGRVDGEDVLEFVEQTGITTIFDASTGTLTMSGTAGVAADIAAYQTLLRSVSYSNSSTTPTAGTRTIRFTIEDGSDNSFADFVLQLNDEAS